MAEHYGDTSVIGEVVVHGYERVYMSTLCGLRQGPVTTKGAPGPVLHQRGVQMGASRPNDSKSLTNKGQEDGYKEEKITGVLVHLVNWGFQYRRIREWTRPCSACEATPPTRGIQRI